MNFAVICIISYYFRKYYCIDILGAVIYLKTAIFRQSEWLFL